jgi:N-acetylglucosamine malate deacetylase 1
MRVIVVATHPDDETLGCGGTLLKHRKNGDEIHWLIVTDVTPGQGFSQKKILEREGEIKKVTKMYGFKGVHRLGIPTMTVDLVPGQELIAKIAQVFQKVKPNVVYLPFQADVHSDHRKIFEAAYSCVKTFRYPFIRKVLMMEVPSETEFAPALGHCHFVPNYFVDISGFMVKKLAIMKIFKSELGEHPFPRSLKNLTALATFRGATAGCDYAESFMLLKEIG